MLYDRTTFLTSSPQTITEEKYCLIFQVVGQLTVIPYASLGGGLILNIYNKSVYPSKMCIFRVAVVLYFIQILLKYDIIHDFKN